MGNRIPQTRNLGLSMRLYSGLQNPWKLRNLGDYRERAALAKESITNGREQIDRLQPIRVAVLNQIDEHRTELKENVLSEHHMAQALNSALDQEVVRRVGRGSELPAPQFSTEELKRLRLTQLHCATPTCFASLNMRWNLITVTLRTEEKESRHVQ